MHYCSDSSFLVQNDIFFCLTDLIQFLTCVVVPICLWLASRRLAHCLGALDYKFTTIS